VRKTLSIFILLTIFSAAVSRAQDHPYELSLSGSFTFSAKLYFDPNDPDDVLRSQYYELDNIFGAGIDVRRLIEDRHLMVGIDAEYLSTTTAVTLPVASNQTITVHDGFSAIPVELSGYFILPFSPDQLRIYIGGGGAVYYGTRQFTQDGVDAAAVQHSLGGGIQVVSGTEWQIGNTWGVRGEMKFRDIQFKSTVQFSPAQAAQEPYAQLSTSPLASRIDIDGLMLSLGLVYRF
jgi:outer membrane protein W